MNQDAMMTESVLDAGISKINAVRWWAFFVVSIVVVFLSGCYWMVNGDIWWHLKAGELIRATGTVPDLNQFTFTNPDTPWIDLHWLFQVVVSWIYDSFGTPGLVLVKSGVGTTVFAILMLIHRHKVPGWVMASVWAPFISIYCGRFHVRPEMITHLLLSLVLAILYLHSTGKTRWIWCLIPIQILWVNSQGLFVLQLAVLGAYALQCQWWQWRGTKVVNSRMVWGVVALCFVATLANPYGIAGAIFPLELLGKVGGEHREFFQLLAGETIGMSSFLARYGLDAVFLVETPRLLLCTSVPVAIVLAVSSLRFKDDSWLYKTLLLLGFGYLAWNMNRNAALYAIVWGYVGFDCLAKIFAHHKHKLVDSDSQPFPITDLVAGIVFLFFGFTTVSLMIDVLQKAELDGSYSLNRRAGFGEHPWYHHDAAKFIASIEEEANVYAFYNGTGFAGVVIYHAYRPDTPFSKRVFADARLEANSILVLDDFLAFMQLGNIDLQKAESILDKYHSKETILAIKNGDLLAHPSFMNALIESTRWRSVYFSDAPDLYEGITIFVPEKMADRLNLEIVPVTMLRLAQ